MTGMFNLPAHDGCTVIVTQAFKLRPTPKISHYKTMKHTAPNWGPEAASAIRLDDWSCFEVKQARCDERTHHLVGSICGVDDESEVRTGCVTNAIVSVDPQARCVLTDGGTAYVLGRCSEMTPDAFYVWRRWQRAGQAFNVVEVTVEINAVLAPFR